ncbi:MAG: hypothetical protein HYZ16_08745 [Bacteroidetes bacterium]|jgi:hypothetical protein|nr:hypothetical protein [Bacteroidota bacterium]
MENFGIGVHFIGPVVRRYVTSLSDDEVLNVIKTPGFLGSKSNTTFCTKLSFFNIMFPFGHFAKIKGRVLKNNVIELTIVPILVRTIQLFIITLYSLTLSAVRLYDNRDWKVLAILAVHFAILCTVWWIIRLVYVADARHKYLKIKKILLLEEER